MFTPGFFVRLMIAAVVIVLLFLAVPAFCRLIGFPVTGDLLIIVKVALIACALWFVFYGKTPA